MAEELLVAGVVGAARGLQGEVSIILRTDVPEQRFFSGANLLTDNSEFPELTIDSVRSHGDRFYATFVQIASREEAESLKHTELLVRPLEEEGAWYPHELEGLEVFNSEGELLGTVTGMQTGLAQDLLQVDAAGQTVLVPMVEEILAKVDLAAGRVLLTPPEGLFPDLMES